MSQTSLLRFDQLPEIVRLRIPAETGEFKLAIGLRTPRAFVTLSDEATEQLGFEGFDSLFWLFEEVIDPDLTLMRAYWARFGALISPSLIKLDGELSAGDLDVRAWTAVASRAPLRANDAADLDLVKS